MTKNQRELAAAFHDLQVLRLDGRDRQGHGAFLCQINLAVRDEAFVDGENFDALQQGQSLLADFALGVERNSTSTQVPGRAKPCTAPMFSIGTVTAR